MCYLLFIDTDTGTRVCLATFSEKATVPHSFFIVYPNIDCAKKVFEDLYRKFNNLNDTFTCTAHELNILARVM